MTRDSSSYDAQESQGPTSGPSPSERAKLYGLEALESLWPELLGFTKRYWTTPESLSVYDPPEPGSVYRSLPETLPEEGSPLEDLLSHFQESLMPGLLHWNHPGFFGFFPCNTSAPSLASAVLTATLNVNPFSWNAGPAATELEARVVSWFAKEAHLDWKGCLQDTASSATLCAVIAARERARRAWSGPGELPLETLCAYVSTEAHNSVSKAIFLAGIPRSGLRKIPTRDDLSLDPEALAASLKDDRQKGLLPFFLCSTSGSTSSTAFDHVDDNAKILSELRENGTLEFAPWHHVDAALAGALILLPECRPLFQGLEQADSFVFNPHKWLFTHFECSVFLAKDSRELKAALSDDPSYLKELHQDETSMETGVDDFRNWSIQLGRGFRSLKLWFVLRHFGKHELQRRLRHHLQMTQELADRFESEQGREKFTLLSRPRINTICFRLGTEERTLAFHKMTRERGRIYLTPTHIRDTLWIRIAIGQTALLKSDLDALWDELVACEQKI